MSFLGKVDKKSFGDASEGFAEGHPAGYILKTPIDERPDALKFFWKC